MSFAAMPGTQTMINMYQKMTLIKQTNERIRDLTRAGKFAFTHHSSRGQEVIPSAISVHLSDDDYICTIYRGIHDMLAKGLPSRLLWAELAGRKTGACKGKGGPMHIAYPAKGIMVTTAIVGASMLIANGLALAAQIRKEQRVTIAYFGDGASNIGGFHEALNLASVWKLPVIFVCQNNGYSEHSRSSKMTSVPNISQRASSYQIPGITVDGNNPFAVWSVAKDAIERARSGLGPTLIEARTFRFFGHTLPDEDQYMHQGEKLWAMAHDPVPAFRKWLVDSSNSTESQLSKIESDTSMEIDEAVEFAISSPFPEVDELDMDVYQYEAGE